MDAAANDTVSTVEGATILEKSVIAMYVVMSPAGCLGNLVIVLLLLVSSSLRKDAFMIAFASLALADFICFTAVIPIATIHAYFPAVAESAPYQILEPVIDGLRYASWYVSEFHIMLIALARYLAVCRPASRPAMFIKSVRGMMLLVVFLWLVPGLLYMVFVWTDYICMVYNRKYVFYSLISECPGSKLTGPVSTIYTSIIIVVSSLSYLLILRKSIKQRITMGTWHHGNQQHAKKERSLTMQCFIPHLIYILEIIVFKLTFNVFSPLNIYLGLYWTLFTKFMGMLHFSCNSIVYFVFNKKLRAEFRRKIVLCKRSAPNDQSVNYVQRQRPTEMVNMGRGGPAVGIA